jgi:hypothetical protein
MSWKNGEIREFKYYSRKNKEIPEGWEIVSEMENTRHGHYARLIKKIADE